MAHETHIFNGLCPIDDLADVVEQMAFSTQPHRAALCDALAASLAQRGLHARDANAVAYNLLRVADWMRLAEIDLLDAA